MGRFGGSTPKRHRLWSNDPDLLTSIAGRAGYMSKQEMEQCVFCTVRKYVDGNGVKRHVGNKEVLRDSQCLSNFISCIRFAKTNRSFSFVRNFEIPPTQKTVYIGQLKTPSPFSSSAGIYI